MVQELEAKWSGGNKGQFDTWSCMLRSTACTPSRAMISCEFNTANDKFNNPSDAERRTVRLSDLESAMNRSRPPRPVICSWYTARSWCSTRPVSLSCAAAISASCATAFSTSAVSVDLVNAISSWTADTQEVSEPDLNLEEEFRTSGVCFSAEHARLVS